MDEKQVISVIPYAGGGDLLTDARTIIDGARQYAYSAVNVALVQRNWLLGKRISEEELKEDGKANYGLEIVKNLSRKLTAEYGKGFSGTDLYWCVRFYKAYPEIFASVSKKSLPLLSWTHYRVLLQVEDTKARDWYMNEASAQTWSVRTLQRNISSQYYHRLLQSQNKDLVEKEMLQMTTQTQVPDKLEFVKNPVVAEFLGLESRSDFTENTLEGAIISNL